MQMFVLDAEPSLSARFLCDSHVRVICREVTMLLSSWYTWNIPTSSNYLPYKPMNENQPLAKQFISIPVRRWAIDNAEATFREFQFRFGKEHASAVKFRQLISAIELFDRGVCKGTFPVQFTFVAKDFGIFPGKTLSQAVKLYREYYSYKMRAMLHPPVWTRREKPRFLSDVI